MLYRVLGIVLWLAFDVAAQSSYPLLYAGIGDGVYKSAEGYEALMKLESFKSEQALLRTYSLKARQLKERGFALDKQEHKERSGEYIAALRELDKEKKELHRRVLKKIGLLKKQKAYAELEVLMKSPDPEIARAAYVKDGTISEPIGRSTSKTAPADELQRSLIKLKGRLLTARNENSPDVRCLNDITAINYWMVEADVRKKGRDWCRAYDACEQTINFERAAARSCSEEDPLYQTWRKRSEQYRTAYKDEYAKACR